MAGTRSSARQANKSQSSPPKEQPKTGTKRKAESNSPPAKTKKRGRPSKASKELAEKEQKTIEETLPAADMTEADAGVQDDVEMNDAKPKTTEHSKEANEESHGNGNGHKDDNVHSEKRKGSSEREDEKNGKADDATPSNETDKVAANGNAFDEVKADAGEEGKSTKIKDKSTDATEDKPQPSAIKEDASREHSQPSTILEKGIIYFFTRGRVDVNSPDSVQDLARSYFVLRPLPPGARITSSGIIPDKPTTESSPDTNTRLLALPKKVWPQSTRDRFLVFVEKGRTTLSALKKDFFPPTDYTTQTAGARHTPSPTAVGEGVYAITHTGSDSHLAYMLTIPSQPGDVQKDLGIRERGRFGLSLKNPETPGPANTQGAEKAEFSKDVQEAFRGRRWMPVLPEHLDYDNAQILLIGAGDEKVEGADGDNKEGDGKETITEELELLEEEDEVRVGNMKGDDTVFDDLGLSSKDYPDVMTTW